MPDHDEPAGQAAARADEADAAEAQAARLERALERIALAAQSVAAQSGCGPPGPLVAAREIVGRLDALIGQLRVALGPASGPDA